jgi:hypothetical protein
VAENRKLAAILASGARRDSARARSSLEPSLRNSSLRFPGNANYAARDKAAKSPLKLCRPLEETFATSKSPPIAGIRRLFRKSLRTSDCVVGLGGLEPGDKHAVVSNLSPNGRCCDQMSLD